MALFTDTTCKVDILILWIGVITVYYYFARRIYTYWDRRGFKTIPGTSYIFGHLKETFLSREFLGDAVARLYRSSSEPFIGIYTLFRPILLVRDPEIVRSILIKDFAHFNERSVHCDKDTDSFSSTLFSLPGAEWKSLRAKLTPAFTSGKLKAMFSTLVDCGHGLQNYLEKLADKGDILDVREISASHATNVIASVVFGIEVDTVNDPNNEFRICGRKIFEFTIPNAIRWFLYHTAPKLMSIFRVKTTAPSVEAFIRSVVKQNLEYREKNNICRKDLFQLMIQLRNTGSVQLDDHWETVIKGNEHQKAMTEEEIAAESFLFFLAGFETSSTTISFCMYELAKNPEIQQRVHNEIDKILEKHNGQITYESVSEMKYLEYCIDETLRKYPVVPVLSRRCVTQYTIPGTNNIIEKGTAICLPVLALQRDETYYKEPLKFDPDRFNEENSAGKNFVNRPYLPFGDGPRNCIGMRMGKMQTKAGLLMMLKKFRYELKGNEKNRELQFVPKLLFLAPVGGVNLHVFKR